MTFAHSIGSVHHRGDLLGECALGRARCRPVCDGGGELLDFRARPQAEDLEVPDNVAVVGVDPELVEGVRRGHRRVEPDGARLGLSELRAVGFGDERRRQRVHRNVFIDDAVDEVEAGGEVAPLVAPPVCIVQPYRR